MGIDLKKFCSKAPNRFNIHEPFSKGKWTYATDGHICIRVPRAKEITKKITHGKDTPDAEQIFIEADKDGLYEWVPVPEVKMEIRVVECNGCHGRGKLGRYLCEECRGEGHLQKGQPIKFPFGFLTITLNSIYLELIRNELPNPQIGLTEKAVPLINSSSMKPVKIRFDGGQGLLMPFI